MGDGLEHGAEFWCDGDHLHGTSAIAVEVEVMLSVAVYNVREGIWDAEDVLFVNPIVLRVYERPFEMCAEGLCTILSAMISNTPRWSQGGQNLGTISTISIIQLIERGKPTSQ